MGGKSWQASLALGVTVALVALAASGCGGSSSSSSSSAGGGGSSTSSGSTMSSSTDTSGGGGSLSDDAFCSKAKQISAQFRSETANISADASSPTKLKQLIQNEQQAFSEIVAVAPSDIKPSLDTINTAIQPFYNTLKQYDYSLAKAAAHLNTNTFNTPAVKQAEAKVEAWATVHHCKTSS